MIIRTVSNRQRVNMMCQPSGDAYRVLTAQREATRRPACGHFNLECGGFRRLGLLLLFKQKSKAAETAALQMAPARANRAAGSWIIVGRNEEEQPSSRDPAEMNQPRKTGKMPGLRGWLVGASELDYLPCSVLSRRKYSMMISR